MNRTVFWVICFLTITTVRTVSSGVGENRAMQFDQLGIEQMQRMNPRHALSAFKRAIRAEPHSRDVYPRAVQVYLFLDRGDEARSYFDSLACVFPEEPAIWYALAHIEYAQKRFKETLTHLKKVIQLDPDFQEAYGYKSGIAETYAALGNLDAALEYLNTLRRKYPQNARVEYGIARCFIRRYDWPRALHHLEKAIALAPGFTLPYHSKIYIYSRKGHYDEVLRTATLLDSLASITDEADMKAYARMMRGNVYFRRGDYFTALKQLREALAIAQQSGDLRRQGACLNTIASTYAMIGKPEQSLRYFQAVLDLSGRNLLARLRTLLNIGSARKDMKDWTGALAQYRKVLTAARAHDLKFIEAQALTNIAETYAAQGQVKRADEGFLQALPLARRIEDPALVAYILNNRANCKMRLRELPEAVSLFKQALTAGQPLDDAQIVWESASGLGAAYDKMGNRTEACRYYKQAVDRYEMVRQTLAIQQLSNDFLEDKYQAYPSLIRLLAREGELSRAFDTAEKYKAKMLLDILSSRQLFWDEMTPDSLRVHLRHLDDEIERLHSGKAGNSLQLEQRLVDAGLEKAGLMRLIQTQNPRYFELINPNTLSAAYLRSQILNEKQALVEYVIGENESTVFVITKDSLSYHSLSMGRTELRQLLTAVSPLYDADRSARAPISDAISADFKIDPSFKLYVNLIAPLRRRLAGIDHLVIVPDDWLHYLPFEMLVTDTSAITTEYDFQHARYLIEEFAVSYAQSASLLNPDLTQSGTVASKGVLAFGNPSLSPKDKDLPGTFTPADEAPPTLSHLPAAETEVESIAEIFDRSFTTTRVGPAATESAFKHLAPEYNILHLATHFVNNDTDPLYSSLFLARAPDDKDDGALHTYEIFGLQLKAKLAVLSACNTGGGRFRVGEGLMGIYRAFLYAGTPSLLLTTWNVDDISTATIMTSFYRYLSTGLDKSTALRRAKLDYINSSENQKRDPYYWAPFVLLGDWQPAVAGHRKHGNALPLFALLLIAAISVVRAPAAKALSS